MYYCHKLAHKSSRLIGASTTLLSYRAWVPGVFTKASILLKFSILKLRLHIHSYS